MARRSIAQALFLSGLLRNDIDSPVLRSEIPIYNPLRALSQRDFLLISARRTGCMVQAIPYYNASYFSITFPLLLTSTFPFNPSSSSSSSLLTLSFLVLISPLLFYV